MGRRLSLVAAVSTLALGCGFFMEPTPDVDNPEQASAGAVEVKYPGNWKTSLETDTIEGVEFSSLTIESSGNAIAVVQVFEPAVPLEPDEVFTMYMEGVTEASKTEMGGLVDVGTQTATSPFSHDLLGSSVEGRTATYNLSMLGETVPHKIQTVHTSTDDYTVVVVAQAPAEDWAKAEPGFELIYGSMRAK
ncbi:MAG: hypothetical protein AAGA54_13820 [Myxococcota bacterium]